MRRAVCVLGNIRESMFAWNNVGNSTLRDYCSILDIVSSALVTLTWWFLIPSLRWQPLWRKVCRTLPLLTEASRRSLIFHSFNSWQLRDERVQTGSGSGLELGLASGLAAGSGLARFVSTKLPRKSHFCSQFSNFLPQILNFCIPANKMLQPIAASLLPKLFLRRSTISKTSIN